MRISAILVLALLLGACSRSDQERAREQARQTAEHVKHDSREAFAKAEIETKKASRELNEGLEKAQQKTRRALNQPGSPPDRDHK